MPRTPQKPRRIVLTGLTEKQFRTLRDTSESPLADSTLPWHMFYRCPECQHKWEADHDFPFGTRCPQCHCHWIPPYQSIYRPPYWASCIR